MTALRWGSPLHECPVKIAVLNITDRDPLKKLIGRLATGLHKTCTQRSKSLELLRACFSQQICLINNMKITHMKTIRLSLLVVLAFAAAAIAQQQATKHLLSREEVTKVTPTEYFYRGQKALVQMRNAVGFQLADSKMTLAALVDASGYSTAIQQKYQGMLITESKLNIGGSELAPGQYGFGFTADGKFVVMDVANNDVLGTDYQTDQEIKRPVPLKLIEDGDSYKLYAGRKWVSIKVQ
jgi:hypothetical protein